MNIHEQNNAIWGPIGKLKARNEAREDKYLGDLISDLEDVSKVGDWTIEETREEIANSLTKYCTEKWITGNNQKKIQWLAEKINNTEFKINVKNRIQIARELEEIIIEIYKNADWILNHKNS